MLKNCLRKTLLFGLAAVLLGGCVGSKAQNQPASVRFAFAEAAWIQNGKPASFENELWYPQDDVENLLDSEVYVIGQYEGIRLYAEYSDVQPYNRIYTRFAKNRYRLFEKKQKSLKND